MTRKLSKRQEAALQALVSDLGEILRAGPLTMAALMAKTGLDHRQAFRTLSWLEKAKWLDRIGGEPGKSFRWIVRKK